MSARIVARIFFAFVFLHICSAHAVTYYWYTTNTVSGFNTCGQKPSLPDLQSCEIAKYTATTPAGAPYTAGAIVVSGTTATIKAYDKTSTLFNLDNAAVRGGDSCSAGSTYNATTGACDQSCSISGQTHDGTGACVCPSGTAARGSSGESALTAAQGQGSAGWSALPQKCENIADNCGRRAANNDMFRAGSVLTKSNNCAVTCALVVGGAAGSFNCYYSGQPAVPNGNLTCSQDTSGELCAQAVGSAATQNLNSAFTPGVPASGCPTGTSQGTFNGVAGCASASGANVATSSTPGAGAVGGGSVGGTNTQITTTTTTTGTMPDGSTVTTSITNTQGTLGTASNPLQTQQAGAHQCDPTAASYAQCINMAAQVQSGVTAANGSGNGSGSSGPCDPKQPNYLQCIAGQQTALTHTETQSQSFGDAANKFFDDFKQTQIGSLASGNAMGGTLSVGACPTGSFEAFNRTYTIDYHCTLYDQISPTLTTMMHIVWVVTGIFILLSA